jgi:hypothetical protein
VRFRTFCAIGFVVLAVAACGGNSGSENFTEEDVVQILTAAPPLPEGSSWTESGALERGSFEAERPDTEDEVAELAQAGLERKFEQAWVSSGNSAYGEAVLFRDEAGAETGFDILQHLTPGWFFPQPVTDLGDEAVSSHAEPGAVYIWRRGDVVLFAWMFRDRGSSFDYDAAARAYADQLDERATAD